MLYRTGIRCRRLEWLSNAHYLQGNDNVHGVNHPLSHPQFQIKVPKILFILRTFACLVETT